MVENLVDLYREVIDEHRAAVSAKALDVQTEHLAVARHLRWWAANWEPLLREEARRYRRSGTLRRLGRSLSKRATSALGPTSRAVMRQWQRAAAVLGLV
jgi:hypothetical protein